MRTFRCGCGNQLFFGNTLCLKCGSEAGYCPACRQVVSLVPGEGEQLVCGNAACGIPLKKCQNYAVENVCTGCIPLGDQQTDENGEVVDAPSLCQHCRLTAVIPDLTVPGNRELWARLEDAKRRVLFVIEEVGLPVGRPENDIRPELTFDFRADGETPVFTGHDQGKITINIREADDVEREKARVAFREPQRTLVGHIRHELGHYYWDVLVSGQQEEEFRQMFGDERDPPYDQALQNYYQNGPQAGWQNNFISAYATMHPWEDFAESFGTYLDMVSILQAARNLKGHQLRNMKFETMLEEYRQVGIQANEMNREMGLKDLVPEVFGPVVTEKLRFIHRLVMEARQQARGVAREPAAVAVAAT